MAGLIGQRIGSYLITGLLGEGGMAAVYRAHQESMGRDVAIKIIESKLARNPEFTKRFEREAHTIAALSHSHILKVFDYGRQDDLIYLVMELLPGGSLADQIKRKPLDLPDAARLLDQIGDALDYAHDKGIIHRDLKPQNVLLDERGNAILTDFGIAKLLNETTALTHSGIAMGTPFYMSPEQCQGGTIDARSDLYALGVMLFEMLTGDVPFKSDTPISLLYMHINQPPPSVRQNRPDLPEAVERVILKALAKPPDTRFQSAGELVTAFRVAATGVIPPGLEEVEPPGERTARTPIPAIPAARAAMPHEEAEVETPQQSRRGILALGLVGLIALIGIAVILLSGRGGGAVTPAASPTAPLIAANPTETNTPSLTSTLTFTATVSFTSPPPKTATNTVVPTTVPTETNQPSLTPSETQDPIKAAETLFFGGLTQTATLWTLTPTETFTASPNLTETVGARLTEIVIASYTKTPIPSDTPTFTPMPTATSTFTPTSTLTHTFTSTPTATPTATATHTPTITPTPAPTLIPAGTSNTLWTPIERDFDGVTMVLVPAGCFMMGISSEQADSLFDFMEQFFKADRAQLSDEQPQHRVCISAPFWIDKDEVTNGQFTRLKGVAATRSYFAKDEYPRDQITWLEANEYCKRRGARLPTEAEWEYAARGPESLLYPWGNAYVSENFVHGLTFSQGSGPVESRPAGISWVGAQDMLGNVEEWVADWYRADYYTSSPVEDPQGPGDGTNRVVRGGSSAYYGASEYAANRYSYAPDFMTWYTGVRCARPYENESIAIITTPAPTTIAAAATPIPAGTSNTVWVPVERDFDGVTMVLVPAGCFMMGSNEAGASAKPIHEVCFDSPFWIDQTEVTNAQYGTTGNWSQPNAPREQVNWFEADAFCRKRDARLPTDAEWEYAARGPEGWIYPWGNTFVAENTVYYGDSGTQPSAVGSKPGGISWIGALDLSGNVWEWVNDWYDEGYYASSPRINPQGVDEGQYRILRGGSWAFVVGDVRAVLRRPDNPALADVDIGFRCARDVEETSRLITTPAPMTIEAAVTDNQACSGQIPNDRSVNVRQGPGTLYPVIASFAAGETFAIVGYAAALDDTRWWKVERQSQNSESGVSGWVADRVITTSGACERVTVAATPPVPTAQPESASTANSDLFTVENFKVVSQEIRGSVKTATGDTTRMDVYLGVDVTVSEEARALITPNGVFRIFGAGFYKGSRLGLWGGSSVLSFGKTEQKVVLAMVYCDAGDPVDAFQVLITFGSQTFYTKEFKVKFTCPAG